MIELLIGATPLPNNPLIETVKEPVVIEQKIEVTWRDNPQGCNEEIQWIAEEAPYYCIPKKVATTARVATKRAVGAVNASDGWFPYGQCTYFVASQRSVGQWNNASSWLRQARADGWATGLTPVIGAIAWESNHVSLVIAVNNDNVTVREMNYQGFGVISTRTAPASQFKYIY